MKYLWLLLAFETFCFDSVQSYQCYKGFNVSVLGVPLSHWKQTTCFNCFMQELAFPFLQTDLEVRVRYGGCMSKAYADLMTCENLFGKDSKLEPVKIFNGLAELSKMYDLMFKEFQWYDPVQNYRELFSNGNGIESFINGSFTLLENLGLDTTKAEPLRPKFVGFMDAVLPWETLSGFSKKFNKTVADAAVQDFMDTLREVIDAYQVEYPNSEIPGIAWRFAEFIKASYDHGYPSKCPKFEHTPESYIANEKCLNAYDNKLIDINGQAIDVAVDLQYAINAEFDFDALDLYEELLKAFPDFDYIIRMGKTLDRDDFKQLYKDFYTYTLILDRNKYLGVGLFQQIHEAFNRTVEKLQSKFKIFTDDLKHRLLPKSCKTYTCKNIPSMVQICGTHEKLTNTTEMVINRNAPTEALATATIASSEGSEQGIL